ARELRVGIDRDHEEQIAGSLHAPLALAAQAHFRAVADASGDVGLDAAVALGDEAGRTLEGFAQGDVQRVLDILPACGTARTSAPGHPVAAHVATAAHPAEEAVEQVFKRAGVDGLLVGALSRLSA